MSGNQFRRALRELVSNLDTLSVPWALIGGLAAAVHSEPVGVRSRLQLALSDGGSARSVQESLVRRGYEVGESPRHPVTGGTGRIRLRAPVEGYPVSVDLVFGDSGIEPEVVATSTRMEMIPGLTAPVAGTGQLVALGVLADGCTAQVWLSRLLAYADGADLCGARTALGLITARGFHRDKDLLADLEGYLRMGTDVP